MTTDTLTRTIRAAPFRPFWLRLADGRSLPVPHPDFIAFPGGRTAIVMDETEGFEIVDRLLVVSLGFEGQPTPAGV